MHVHVNAAASVDGKLATRERRQVAISGPDDFARVDRLRGAVDGVLVGVGTVLADDPSLTTPDGEPARIVVDSAGRMPLDARVLSPTAPTYLLVSDAIPRDRRARLEGTGATVIETPPRDDDRVDLAAGLDALEAAGIERLLVEGGGEVVYSLFAAGRVDVLTVFTSPHVVGGRDAPTLVDGAGFTERFPRLRLEASDRVDAGLLCRYAVEGWSTEPAAVHED